MKKIKYILPLILAITLGSCKKFLEKEPIGRVGKQVLFEDIQGAKVGLTGAYTSMLTYYRNEFGMFGDVASDNVINVPTTGDNSVMLEVFNFTATPDDILVTPRKIWVSIFETLNNVNNLLNAIPALKDKFPGNLAEIERIEGQALVLRALCHFDLSRVYAQPYNFTADASHLGVPILTKTPAPATAVPRATMKQTYDQILADLNNALPYLSKYNNATDQALISYQAALGLLSRVYLYKGDWVNCVKSADLVIADTRYQLASAAEYPNVFVSYPNKDAAVKKELLFVLSANGTKVSGSREILNVFSGGNIQYVRSPKLTNKLDDNDIRKTNTFSNTITKKYGNDLTIKVIRLAEVYLNRAEASWNLQKYNEAKADIEVISSRAHAAPVTITYTDPTDLYEKISDERNRELCFEGHRFFDIVRRKENLQRGTGCNSVVCGINYPDYRFALPINTRELDANPAMQQNPGYK